jgi:acyl-CoA thioesterase FadM
MYPFLRLARVAAAARRRPPLALDQESELRLRCWPIDLDMFGEMNNGRVLTLCDLGRFDHFIRSGVLAASRRRGWGFAVAGVSARYRRRVRAFEPIRLLTRPLGRDARFFYVHQAMEVRGRPASSVLVRAACTRPAAKAGGGLVETDAVMAALGRPDWRPELPGWVAAWAEAEAARPWPPG